MVPAKADLFEQQVRQYTDFVYSSAIRQVRGDEHLAEEVTQAVFILLAEKHDAIRSNRLVGWLFNTTRYLARNAMRREARRRRHEKQAGMESAMRTTSPEDLQRWEAIQGSLDEAIAQLHQSDRDVLLLHYFERTPLTDVAVMLGLSEIGTRKRASRAVDRLRKYFARKGIVANSLDALILNYG